VYIGNWNETACPHFLAYHTASLRLTSKLKQKKEHVHDLKTGVLRFCDVITFIHTS